MRVKQLVAGQGATDGRWRPSADELDMLVPAYAVTIHKSQGSEYPAVVIPAMAQHYAMLQRNLLYTTSRSGSPPCQNPSSRRQSQATILFLFKTILRAGIPIPVRLFLIFLGHGFTQK